MPQKNKGMKLNF